MKTTGLPLFRQTLIVLVGTVILSQLAGFVTVVLLPQSGPSSATLSGIARQLADKTDCEEPVPALEHARRLHFSRSDRRPEIPAALSSDPLLTGQLGRALDVPEDDLFLAWAPESEIRTGHVAEVTVNDRRERVEETIFLGQLVFARRNGEYWCVGEVPPPRWYNHWKTTVALAQLVTLAVFLLLVWWFARRLSRPIRDFAAAADAAGRDDQAPLLEEKGPREMRVAARALNSMQARIQAQAREREAMIASIAHDLRTPLSRIAFRVETASPDVSESVQRDIEQMNAIITSTLDFTRESITPREDGIVDLRHLLQSMVEDENDMGRDIRFLSAADEMAVRGNEVQLNRLFQNLLDNAWNFGGAAEVYLRRDGDSAVVEITDRGPGIEESQMDEMLEPFTRGEPSRNRETGGMGLGLSIARIIARRHGGAIRLVNREGGGLKVSVRLPMAKI